MTCSHWFWMALSAQTIVTRSEPPSPAPIRTLTLAGGGASDQSSGVSSLPTSKTKSAAVMPAGFGTPARSTMMPLMPRV